MLGYHKETQIKLGKTKNYGLTCKLMIIGYDCFNDIVWVREYLHWNGRQAWPAQVIVRRKTKQ